MTKKEEKNKNNSPSAWHDFKESVGHFGKALYHTGGFIKNVTIGHDASKIAPLVSKQATYAQTKYASDEMAPADKMSPQKQQEFEQEKKQFFKESRKATWGSLSKASAHLSQSVTLMLSAIFKTGSAFLTQGAKAIGVITTRDQKKMIDKPIMTAMTGTQNPSAMPQQSTTGDPQQTQTNDVIPKMK